MTITGRIPTTTIASEGRAASASLSSCESCWAITASVSSRAGSSGSMFFVLRSSTAPSIAPCFAASRPAALYCEIERSGAVVSSPPKQTQVFETAEGEKEFVLERAIVADFGLVRAWKGDRHGNLVYRDSARNFNPLAAMAGRVTIAEVEELVEPGGITPEDVHLPGVFVNRVVVVGTEGKGIEYRTNRPRTDRSAAPAAAGDEATEGDAR